MSRLVAPPPNDERLWRLALARLHPDAGGSEDLFVWAQLVREAVEAEACRSCPRHNAAEPRSHRTGADRTGDQADQPARVPFPERVSHVELLRRTLDLARDLEGPLGAVLERLGSYQQNTSGRHQLAEQRGATYKQLRYLAALAKVEPREVYEAAEAVPFSQAMAGHLISDLKGGA